MISLISNGSRGWGTHGQDVRDALLIVHAHLVIMVYGLNVFVTTYLLYIGIGDIMILQSLDHGLPGAMVADLPGGFQYFIEASLGKHVLHEDTKLIYA